MTKSRTIWLQDIEISVYLPIFSLTNGILGLLNCSAPGARVRIKTVLTLLAKKPHQKSGNIEVLCIYVSIYFTKLSHISFI